MNASTLRQAAAFLFRHRHTIIQGLAILVGTIDSLGSESGGRPARPQPPSRRKRSKR